MGRSVCAEFTASAESYFEVRDDLAKRTLTTDDFMGPQSFEERIKMHDFDALDVSRCRLRTNDNFSLERNFFGQSFNSLQVSTGHTIRAFDLDRDFVVDQEVHLEFRLLSNH